MFPMTIILFAYLAGTIAFGTGGVALVFQDKMVSLKPVGWVLLLLALVWLVLFLTGLLQILTETAGMI